MKNPFLDRWSDPARPGVWADAVRWVLRGGELPAGFGVTPEGRLDLRGLVIPPIDEIDSVIVPGLGDQDGWRASIVANAPVVRNRTWTDIDLSFSALPDLRMDHGAVTNCVFDHAVLRGARLYDLAVDGTSFVGADLRDVAFGNTVPVKKKGWFSRKAPSIPVWRNVVFDDALMDRDTFFRGWHADGASFRGTRMNCSSFDQCTLNDIVMSGRVQDVVFDFRTLPDRPEPGRFTNSDLTELVAEIWIQGVHLENVRFNDDCRVYAPYVAIATRALEILSTSDSPASTFATKMIEDLRYPGDLDAAHVFQGSTFVEGADTLNRDTLFSALDQASIEITGHPGTTSA